MESLQEMAPDVLGLQEIKAMVEQLPEELQNLPGYHSNFYSAERKGYSGVVTYSKEKLNINSIVSKARYGSGDFVTRIKKAVQYKTFKGADVTFNKYKIAFNASSKSASAKVVPIFIEMNHQ